MRAYLLYIVAVGLGKCGQAESPTLVDSFNATLLIPETEENFRHSASHDDASYESFSQLETKRNLQGSALGELATIDESQAESLMDRAELSVRRQVLSTMVHQATTAKNYDHALDLLGRMPPEGFPYGVATNLMLSLPESRDPDKRNFFDSPWPPTVHDIPFISAVMTLAA